MLLSAAIPRVACCFPSTSPNRNYERLVFSQNRLISYGEQNVVFEKPGEIEQVRVIYRRGSIDPGSSLLRGAPSGGAIFLHPFDKPIDCATLAYDIFFAENFDFARGGKLPGLYGGRANSGGRVPKNDDGFSIRLAWKANGLGAVYAYLPTSKGIGTTFNFTESKRFERNRWQRVVVKLKLNQPGHSDGSINVNLSDTEVGSINNVQFRSSNTLTIDGLLFSTFFGGNTPEFSSPNDTSIIFRDFRYSFSC